MAESNPLGLLDVTAQSPSQKRILHIDSFLHKYLTLGSLYDTRAWDAALNHNVGNAELMRNDAYIESLLQERRAPLPVLPWAVVPESNDFEQDAQFVTQVINRFPMWAQFIDYLDEATWYGRYGSQLGFRWDVIDGQNVYIPVDHQPVIGDKIIWDWNSNPAILIGTQARSKYPSESLVTSPIGPALKLDRPSWRAEFVIHQHRVRDSAYERPQAGARVHGYGLRSPCYWVWNLRNEVLQWVFNALSRVGITGLVVIWYEEGNPTAEATAKQAAQQAQHDTVIVLGRPVSTSLKESMGVQHFPTNTSGLEEAQRIVDRYFEVHIERLIVGQSMSSGADGENGLGGSGRARLAGETKANLIRYDAVTLAETLTRDFVEPICRINRPNAVGKLKFKFVLPKDDEQAEFTRVDKAVSWGLKVSEKDAYEAASLKKPKDDEPSIGGPQQQQGGMQGGEQQEPDVVHEESEQGSVQDVQGDQPDLSPEDESAMDRAEGGVGGVVPYALDDDSADRLLNPPQDKNKVPVHPPIKPVSKPDIKSEGMPEPTPKQDQPPKIDPKPQDQKQQTKSRDDNADHPPADDPHSDWLPAGKTASGRLRWRHGQNGTLVNTKAGIRPPDFNGLEFRKANDDSARAEGVATDSVSFSSYDSESQKHSVANTPNGNHTETMARVLGNDAEAHQIHRLFGNVAGQSFTVSEGFAGSHGFNVAIDHPAVQKGKWTRKLVMGDNGVECRNVQFFLKPKYQGGGFGTKVFVEQVREMSSRGFTKITTIAGKSKDMNGYYTWARLGYDAPLEGWFRGRMPESLKGAKTVQELMGTPEGREYWKAKGYSTNMSFDLHPNSRSMQVLNAYLAEKGGKPIEVDAEEYERKKKVHMTRYRQSAARYGPRNIGHPKPIMLQEKPQTYAGEVVWQPHVIESGPRKGTNAYKNSVTGEIRDSSPSAVGDWHQGKISGLLSRIASVPKVVRQKAAGFVGRMYSKLESKYGGTGAKMVMAGMLVVAPIPIPGTSLLPIALAEAIKRTIKLFRSPKVSTYSLSDSPMTVEELSKVLAASFKEFYRSMGEPVPAIDEDAFRDAASKVLHIDNQPATYADEGRWVTIGGVESDGNHRGGSPVFIKDGRIVKGHPSLVGKKPSELNDKENKGKAFGVRKANQHQREYDRAKIVKEARQQGLDVRGLHSLAEDLLDHDTERAKQWTDMLRDARQISEGLGYGSLHGMSVRNARGTLDATKVKGLDDVAERIKDKYPGMIPEDVDGADYLFDALVQGNRDPMSEAEAYQAAFDMLMEDHQKPTEIIDDDEAIPFAEVVGVGTVDGVAVPYAGGVFNSSDWKKAATGNGWVRKDGGGWISDEAYQRASHPHLASQKIAKENLIPDHIEQANVINVIESRKLENQAHYKLERMIKEVLGSAWTHEGGSKPLDISGSVVHKDGHILKVAIDTKMVTSKDHGYSLSRTAKVRKLELASNGALVIKVALNRHPKIDSSDRGIYVQVGVSDFTARGHDGDGYGSPMKLFSEEELLTLNTVDGVRKLHKRLIGFFQSIDLGRYRKMINEQARQEIGTQAKQFGRIAEAAVKVGHSAKTVAEVAMEHIPDAVQEAMYKAMKEKYEKKPSKK